MILYLYHGIKGEPSTFHLVFPYLPRAIEQTIKVHTVHLCFVKCAQEMISFFFSADTLHARHVRPNNVTISSFGARAYIYTLNRSVGLH